MKRSKQELNSVYEDVTYGLGGAFHFNEAHSTVAGNRQSLMIAESWDLNATGK